MLRACAVLAVVSIAVTLLPEPNTQGASVAYLGSVLMSGIFLVLSMRALPSYRRGPWRWFVPALGLVACGEVWLKTLQVTAPDVWPSPADAFYLIGYVPLALGTLLVDRQRGARTQFGGLLDAIVVSASALVLSLVFLVIPVLTSPDMTAMGKLVGSAYPLADVVLLSLVVRLLFTTGTRTLSIWCLSAGLSCVVLADTLQNIEAVTGTDVARGWMNLFWLISYVFYALAAYHAQRDIEAPPPPPQASGLTLGRLSFLAFAAGLPAVLEVSLAADNRSGYGLHLGLGSLLMLALLVARIWDLLRELNATSEQMAVLARTDPLTGLANRRTWDLELDRYLIAARACRTKVLMAGLLDLDHFKKYNDTQGHQAGDDLLREAAQAWLKEVDGAGVLARWGGEEFAVLMLCPDEAGALDLMDRLRQAVPRGQTCSVGAARWDGSESAPRLLQRADEALYRAKSEGRNRTVLAPPAAVPRIPAQRKAGDSAGSNVSV
ncbi:hypothetical protein GCM10027456_37020 [Kineosporia babensis]